MRARVASCAMRTLPAFAAVAACVLAGCTVIPPADPSRMAGGQVPARSAAPVHAAPAAPSVPPPYAPAPSPEPLPQAAPDQGAGLTYARLGESVTVDGPRVTPLQVLEDSRCPMNARCVWAGQVRLKVRIDSGTGGVVELTTGKPAMVADGTLELVEVRPEKMAGAGNGAVKPADYRFGLRFMGGY